MRRIPPEELELYASEVVRAFGTPDDLAAQIGASLVAADLRGHGSHGVIRLPTLYREMVREGYIDPSGTPEVVQTAATTATVDGNFQFGQAVGRVAVDAVVERAEATGVGAVGVRNAAHLGRIGEWAERATARGYLFGAFVNTGGLGPLVAPPGSADRRLATNPVAFGVPSFGGLDFPLVLDVATSQVAHGKIAKRAVEGKPVPDGWAISEAGEPINDAREFEDGVGAILPLGGVEAGYKGFGLAVVAELFAGALGDSIVAGQDVEGMVNNAAAFLAVDPDQFAAPERNRARLEALAEYLRSASFPDAVPTGPAARGDEALLPGEAEHRIRIEREAEGIPFAEEILALLDDLATEYGVEGAVPDSFA